LDSSIQLVQSSQKPILQKVALPNFMSNEVFADTARV